MVLHSLDNSPLRIENFYLEFKVSGPLPGAGGDRQPGLKAQVQRQKSLTTGDQQAVLLPVAGEQGQNSYGRHYDVSDTSVHGSTKLLQFLKFSP